jgi:transcription antitermination protein NusB
MSESAGIQPKGPSRRRSAARLAAVQALYQIELAGAPVETVIAEFLRDGIDPDHRGAFDEALFADIVRGAVARLAELDHRIAETLTPDWPLERLENVLRAILRAGAYELLERVDVPVPVTISEYLDIGHAFFAGKEPGLINGVLDRLARSLRPEECAGGDRDGAVPPR